MRTCHKQHFIDRKRIVVDAIEAETQPTVWLRQLTHTIGAEDSIFFIRNSSCVRVIAYRGRTLGSHPAAATGFQSKRGVVAAFWERVGGIRKFRKSPRGVAQVKRAPPATAACVLRTYMWQLNPSGWTEEACATLCTVRRMDALANAKTSEGSSTCGPHQAGGIRDHPLSLSLN